MVSKKYHSSRVFYVDYENATLTGAKGCELLSKKDKIIIFIPGGAEKINGNAAIAYIKTKAKIKFVDVSVGKTNALDFQLIMYLGLKYKENKEHYIIADDKGYDYAIKLCHELGYHNVYRYSNIATAVTKTDENIKVPAEPKESAEDKEIVSREQILVEQPVQKTGSLSVTQDIQPKQSLIQTEEVVSEYQDFCAILQNSCGIKQNETQYKDIYYAVAYTNNKSECFSFLNNKYPGPNNTCELYSRIKHHYSKLAEIVKVKKLSIPESIYDILKNQCSLPLNAGIYTCIYQALVQTKNKNEFFQFLREKYGTKDNTVPFYSKIKKKYDIMKSVLE